MEINLHRKWFTPKSTIGQIYMAMEDGKPMDHAAFTLEDCYRGNTPKIQDITAIPNGKYKVILSFSNRFQQTMPELVDVPNFSGIRIHWGNTDKDTDGCILVGDSRTLDFIGGSRRTYAAIFKRLSQVLDRGEEVFINIHGTPTADKRQAA